MDALSQARALLPFWLPYVSLLALPFGFAAAILIARALTPFAYRRVLAAGNAHWTERARLAWPARKWTSLAALAIPAVLGALVAHLGGPLSLLGPAAAGVLAGVTALAGFSLGTWPTARRLHGPSIGGPARFLASSVSLLLVRAPHVVVAAAFAAFMPPRFTGHGFEAASLLAIATILMFAAAFGGGLAVGRLLGLVRPAGEDLRRAVASAAARAGVAPPAACVLACHLPVAFAIPLRRILVFSDSALALLDEAELEAIAAHETGHLTESRSVTFSRVSGLFFFTLLVAAPSLAGEGGRTAFLALLFSLLALVAAGVFSRRTAREMESRADAHAAAHAEGAVYGRALEKLHEAALLPAVLGTRNATHPDLWDRMTAAGSPPAWPKPGRPAGGLAGRLALALACAFVFVLAERGRPGAIGALSRRSPLAAVALTGGAPGPLSELARARAARGRESEAVTLYRAAFTLDGSPGHLANAAFAENRSGRCDAARVLADEALRASRQPGVASLDRYLAGRAVDVARRCGAASPNVDDDD